MLLQMALEDQVLCMGESATINMHESAALADTILDPSKALARQAGNTYNNT